MANDVTAELAQFCPHAIFSARRSETLSASPRTLSASIGRKVCLSHLIRR
jgi:hypothetical protein